MYIGIFKTMCPAAKGCVDREMLFFCKAENTKLNFPIETPARKPSYFYLHYFDYFTVPNVMTPLYKCSLAR